MSPPAADDKPPDGQEAGYLVRPFVKSRYHNDDDPTMAQPSALRPYLLTAGRARAVDSSIEIETQVSVTDAGQSALPQSHLQFEQRDIVELCRRPLSVAEIAARLDLHLGVVRVLVGDLTAAGLLSVLRPAGNSAHDIDTISRVIRGLRAISS